MGNGKIPRAFIDDLLTRIDIVDVIDKYVPLKKTGSNFSARCPFHNEKTPSFSVSRSKQFYHCFGCGVSGNAISFVMDFNHLNFVEAIEDLANFAGVPVPKETIGTITNDTVSPNNSIELYQLLEQVAGFYIGQLRNTTEGKTAVDYLKKRGITGSTAQQFMLGFAPDAWQTLVKQFDNRLLADAGLLVTRDDGSHYDRFRQRIMFPIRDKRGRVIGFGGRVLDDSLPKYLNSPETSVFHKGKEVYGLHELLKANSKPQRILVVEGYMDVITLAQQGLSYAVAALGTATSQAHMDLLFRYASELVFCFDGDRAGQTAAWRAISTVFPSLKDGRTIRIMVLPKDHDPDSLIREEGLAAFETRISNAQALSNYFFEHFSQELKLTEMEGCAKLIDDAKGYLNNLPIGSVFRELMFRELSQLSTWHVDDKAATLAQKQQERSLRQRNNSRPSLPSLVMILLIQKPRLIEIIEQKNINWEGLTFQGIEKFIAILSTLLAYKPPTQGHLVELYRDHPDEALINKLAAWPLELHDGIEKEFSDALDNLLKETIFTNLEQLCAKARDIGLSEEEQQTLTRLLAKKHQSKN